MSPVRKKNSSKGRKLFRFDQVWRQMGYGLVAGLDEAGRGPWAGPLVAAAVVLKPENYWKTLNDSKKVLPEERERLYDVICRESLFYSISAVEPQVVDDLNVLGATFEAMRRALSGIPAKPHLVLVDGPHRIRAYDGFQETIVDGDAKSASIAAASILAKVTRDRLMQEAHKKFPQYGFHDHKGYGTPEHRQALQQHGPCEIHRRSFAPVWTAATRSLPFESPSES